MSAVEGLKGAPGYGEALEGPSDVAPAVRIDLEPFAAFAHQELLEAPLAPEGICWNPSCSRPVNGRKGKKFCSDACQRAHYAELRLIGDKAALAVFAAHDGRHAPKGSPKAMLAAKARTHMSRLFAVWKADRARRRAWAAERDT